MLPLRESAAARPGMTFQQMVERIRYEGAYPTRERVEGVTRTVLADLGRQHTGDERVDLVACLPTEVAVRMLGCRPGWWSGRDTTGPDALRLICRLLLEAVRAVTETVGVSR